MKNPMKHLNTVKGWVITATVLFGGLIAIGANVDRPAWFSELNAVAAVVEANAKSSEMWAEQHVIAAQATVDAISMQVGANTKAILQNEADAVQRRVWDQEDRNAKRPTQDGKDRLRDLIEQLRRLMARISAS